MPKKFIPDKNSQQTMTGREFNLIEKASMKNLQLTSYLIMRYRMLPFSHQKQGKQVHTNYSIQHYTGGSSRYKKARKTNKRHLNIQ